MLLSFWDITMRRTTDGRLADRRQQSTHNLPIKVRQQQEYRHYNKKLTHPPSQPRVPNQSFAVLTLTASRYTAVTVTCRAYFPEMGRGCLDHAWMREVPIVTVGLSCSVYDIWPRDGQRCQVEVCRAAMEILTVVESTQLLLMILL